MSRDALTDARIRSAKPAERPFKLSDGGGLYLLVNPSGSRWWRFKYRVDGRERGISMGVYPHVSLKAAREQREEARAILASGIDPSAKRQEARAQIKQRNARITREEVFAAADEVLRGGDKPSIENVLAILKRGSPNTAGKYLKLWWAQLYSRLESPTQLRARILALAHELLGLVAQVPADAKRHRL